MAISPVIANAVQVRLAWNIAGQGAYNVLNAQASAGVVVNQALAETLGSAIKSAYTSNLQAVTGLTSGLIRVGVRDLRVPNAAEFLDTGAGIPGAATGDPLPGFVSACFTLRTAKSGKSFRGRVYLGGFTEADNDTSGSAALAIATAGVNFLNAVKAAMTASQLTWAVASRPSEAYIINKTTTHNDGTTTTKTLTRVTAKSGGVEPITSVSSRSGAWETQRRRTNGRGVLPTSLGPVAEIRFD